MPNQNRHTGCMCMRNSGACGAAPLDSLIHLNEALPILVLFWIFADFAAYLQTSWWPVIQFFFFFEFRHLQELMREKEEDHQTKTPNSLCRTMATCSNMHHATVQLWPKSLGRYAGSLALSTGRSAMQVCNSMLREKGFKKNAPREGKAAGGCIAQHACIHMHTANLNRWNQRCETRADKPD